MAEMVKNLSACNQETWVQSLGWEETLEKRMATTPIFLPREFHGQRSLAGYSLWGHKELDTTKQLTVENTERDGNTRPPDLPPEKSVCRSGSNS